MTPEAGPHDLLADLTPEDLARYRLARLAGKHNDTLYLGLAGLKEVAQVVKRYAKEKKRIVRTGQEAGLQVSKHDVLQGGSDPRSAAWAAAIALVHPDGTPDNNRMREYVGLPQEATQPSNRQDSGDTPAAGALTLAVGLAPAAQRINAAIASLGDRRGDPVPSIASDLEMALNDHLVSLAADHIHTVAAALAAGDDVIVQIVPDTEEAGVSSSGGQPPSGA